MIFILFAFLIPLVCIVLMKYIPACNQGFLQLMLFGIEAASPSLAAVFATLHKNGSHGLKEFLRLKYRNNLSAKLSIIAFLIPAAVLTAAKLITYFTPCHNEFFTVPSMRKIIVLLWALLAEELGWRGYLQDQIEKKWIRQVACKWGNALVPLFIGIIWILWHYHFLLSGSMDIPFLPFAFGCIAESYGYYVITKVSLDNILPASLWHFSGNLFFNLYLFNPEWNGGSLTPYWIVNFLYLIYPLAFLLYQRQIAINTKTRQ